MLTDSPTDSTTQDESPGSHRRSTIASSATTGVAANDTAGVTHATRQVAEAHSRCGFTDMTTAAGKGHILEVADSDLRRARGTDEITLRAKGNHPATDGVDRKGRSVSYKKGNRNVASKDKARAKGARSTNKAVQQKALRVMDAADGRSDGRVIGAEGSKALDSDRVEASKITQRDLDNKANAYAHATEGLSAAELGKAAAKGGAIGAGIGAGVAVGALAYQAARGQDIAMGEAAVQIGKAATVGAVGGAVGKAASSLLEAAAGVTPAVGRAVAHGGIIGVAVGVAASGVGHGVAVARGSEELADAAREVGKDTALSGLAGLAAVGVAVALAPLELPALVVAVPVIAASTGVTLGVRAIARFGYRQVQGRWVALLADEGRETGQTWQRDENSFPGAGFAEIDLGTGEIVTETPEDQRPTASAFTVLDGASA